MSAVASLKDTEATGARQGIGCMLIGMWLFVGQDVLMKGLLGAQPLWMLICARALISVIILVPVIIWLKGQLYTSLWPIHLIRAFLFTSGFAMFYTAFPFMGLAEVSTIFFSAPLFTAMLAVVFLNERLGVHRIGAVLVGFIGVVIAMAPNSEEFQWIAVLPLICATFYAASMILTRKVGEGESSLTMGLWTIGFSGLLIWPIGWVANATIPLGPEFHHLRLELVLPDGRQLLQLAILGFVGMGGYILVNRAYQVTKAGLIAPFDYTYLPFASLMAWVLWDEVPGTRTLAGMSLIVGAGLYLGYRELKSTRSRGGPAAVGEAVFITNAPILAEPTETQQPAED